MKITSMSPIGSCVNICISILCKIRIFAVTHAVGWKFRLYFALKSSCSQTSLVKKLWYTCATENPPTFVFVCVILMVVACELSCLDGKMFTWKSYFAIWSWQFYLFFLSCLVKNLKIMINFATHFFNAYVSTENENNYNYTNFLCILRYLLPFY